ncbi:META domain-containing protein [Deinococcus humi]|uniref:DUF306 domain-containing protein n=1 Tax=Deinococcus humi TaxID=662880 RepID=A0A7W8JV53_9DEIO|nr:META domain-containing protein [Deinococcus humi]MBB5363520.1 hypothetical protein [Deinococcus humi]GGO30401.1 hypothetical protein GCM10008949_25230 [Deinococcus humi]
MRRLPFLLLASLMGGAQAAVPAPLTGIWQLTGSTASIRPLPAPPEGQLVIANEVHGKVGCGTFRGSINAAAGGLELQVTPDAPDPRARCLYALPGPFLEALNESTHYVISSDTKLLVLYSKKARFAFKRIGYVTPANKGGQR